MNKSQLVDTLAVHVERRRKAAAHALDAVTRELARAEAMVLVGVTSLSARTLATVEQVAPAVAVDAVRSAAAVVTGRGSTAT